ncbi:hypothetical protein AAG570_010871 [Ranatra chinensis]|uniref:Fibroblast growth factor n=1 Tax=Ranatra chinensis TaxID=642074 RepID=A0ABD0YIZ1_9HEMI
MQLYCDTGHHLAILPNGKVIGIEEDMNKYAVMEFTSAGVGDVRIRAVESNMYLAMDNKGRLYGEENPMEEGTVFKESFFGMHNIYLSKKYAHLGWYVGIKKSGKPKPGPQTSRGQKATRFVPRRIHDSPEYMVL